MLKMTVGHGVQKLQQLMQPNHAMHSKLQRKKCTRLPAMLQALQHALHCKELPFEQSKVNHTPLLTVNHTPLLTVNHTPLLTT
jgi:hypothetical protein